MQSPEDWHKNCAGAGHILSVYSAKSDIQNKFKNRTKYRIKSTTSTWSLAWFPLPKGTANDLGRLIIRLCEVTPIKISIKMTIDLENNVDRICSLRTLEMAFQSSKISKISRGACPQTPLVAGLFSTSLIRRWFLKKQHNFIYLKSSTDYLC